MLSDLLGERELLLDYAKGQKGQRVTPASVIQCLCFFGWEAG